MCYVTCVENESLCKSELESVRFRVLVTPVFDLFDFTWIDFAYWPVDILRHPYIFMRCEVEYIRQWLCLMDSTTQAPRFPWIHKSCSMRSPLRGVWNPTLQDEARCSPWAIWWLHVQTVQPLLGLDYVSAVLSLDVESPTERIWVFPKGVFPYKPSILGYHYFWKHPYPRYIKTSMISGMGF